MTAKYKKSRVSNHVSAVAMELSITPRLGFNSAGAGKRRSSSPILHQVQQYSVLSYIICYLPINKEAGQPIADPPSFATVNIA
jgi:hypothetical protein